MFNDPASCEENDGTGKCHWGPAENPVCGPDYHGAFAAETEKCQNACEAACSQDPLSPDCEQCAKDEGCYDCWKCHKDLPDPGEEAGEEEEQKDAPAAPSFLEVVARARRRDNEDPC